MAEEATSAATTAAKSVKTEAKTVNRNCETCKYFDPTADERPPLGECRAHSPQAAFCNPPDQPWFVKTIWPLVDQKDWCGEYDARI